MAAPLHSAITHEAWFIEYTDAESVRRIFFCGTEDRANALAEHMRTVGMVLDPNGGRDFHTDPTARAVRFRPAACPAIGDDAVLTALAECYALLKVLPHADQARNVEWLARRLAADSEKRSPSVPPLPCEPAA